MHHNTNNSPPPPKNTHIQHIQVLYTTVQHVWHIVLHTGSCCQMSSEEGYCPLFRSKRHREQSLSWTWPVSRLGLCICSPGGVSVLGRSSRCWFSVSLHLPPLLLADCVVLFLDVFCLLCHMLGFPRRDGYGSKCRIGWTKLQHLWSSNQAVPQTPM